MDLDSRRLEVKKFCEEEVFDRYKKEEELDDFYVDRRVASLRLRALRTSAGFDCVEIDRIHEDVPESVSENFDRHFWYSQYSLSDIYLIKISVGYAAMYIFLIQGLVDDGWDNSGCWLEIFDEQGGFIDSGTFEDEGICWWGKRIRGEDFYTPSPPWPKDIPDTSIHKPMWSEEILTQYATSIDQDGPKVRYVMPGEYD
jgi:hypothetical protein